jgi:hypothetical protein
LTKKKEDTWRKPTPDTQAFYIGSNSGGKSEGMNDSDRNEMIAAVVSKYPSSQLQNFI